MLLQERLKEREEAIYGIKKKRNKKNIFSVKSVIICSFFLFILGLIYIPQFFIKDKQVTTNTYVLDVKKEALDCLKELPKNEITTEEKKLYEKYIKKNTNIHTPYKMNNVILWADNLESRTFGSVINLLNNCYQFNNFYGYAQFGNYKYAYKIENNKHTLLNKREKEGVWRIDGSIKVFVTNEKLDMVNKIGFMGKEDYFKENVISNALCHILPKKGIVYSEKTIKIDLDPETNIGKELDIKCPIFLYNDYERINTITNTLDDYLKVRAYIDAGSCVAVSLTDKNDGESIGIIYGYTLNGDLLIANHLTYEYAGVLKINPKTIKRYTDNKETEENIFDFYGLGFSSEDNDRINFFAHTDIK